jgi:hypothetical protein
VKSSVSDSPLNVVKISVKLINLLSVNTIIVVYFLLTRLSGVFSALLGSGVPRILSDTPIKIITSLKLCTVEDGKYDHNQTLFARQRFLLNTKTIIHSYNESVWNEVLNHILNELHNKFVINLQINCITNSTLITNSTCLTTSWYQLLPA